MNETELARLAAMGNALRPDWPAQSLKTFLHAFAVNAYRDVAVALAWVAGRLGRSLDAAIDDAVARTMGLFGLPTAR